jgi:hypothetical protein
MDWFYIVPTAAAVMGTAAVARRRRRVPENVRAGSVAVDFLRIFFGAHLVWSGLRFFFGDAQPVIPHPIAGPFIASLTAMGLFPGIKALEIIVGTLLLTKCFIPLALILQFPSTVTIFYMNTFITATSRTVVTGPLELAVHGLLLLSYFGYYRPMLAVNAEPLPAWSRRAAPQ